MSPAETFTTLPGTLPPDGTPALFTIDDRRDVAVLQAAAADGRQVVEIRALDHSRTGTPVCYAAIDASCLDPGTAGRVVDGDVWHDMSAARTSARRRHWRDPGRVNWTVVALWPVTA